MLLWLVEKTQNVLFRITKWDISIKCLQKQTVPQVNGSGTLTATISKNVYLKSLNF